MRGRMIVAMAVTAATGLAACGGDDDAPQGQGEIADELIAAMKESAEDSAGGVTVDEDCVRDKIGGLSDQDAEAISGAWDATEMPDELSAEGAAAFASLGECLDVDLGDVTIPDITIPDITIPDITIPSP